MTSYCRDQNDTLNVWAQALATAPHVLQEFQFDDPERLRRLADSAASLSGLIEYVREHRAADTADAVALDWDLDLLTRASCHLYRSLGLSADDTVARLERFAGGMLGAAGAMQTDPLHIWKQVRRSADSVAVAAV